MGVDLLGGGAGIGVFLVDLVSDGTGDFLQGGGVVPDVLVALDIGDLVRVILGGGLRGIDGHDIGILVQFAVVRQRQGGDDVVLIRNGLVNPGIVAAAVDHEHVGVIGLGYIGRGGFEVVGVGVIAFYDGIDLDVDAGGGIGHGLGNIGPDGGGGDDGKLLFAGVGAGIRVGAGTGVGGARGGKKEATCCE